MDVECLSEHMALTTEFSLWQINNPNKIYCSNQSATEDGRLVLNLSINDTKFRLLCPANYPNHEDTFFMETECTDFWCIALNEFIIDSPQKLTLDAILAKAFLYYTPSSKKSCQSSDFETDNENEDDPFSSDDLESSEDDEWKAVISKRKRDWRAKEGELRLRYNRPKISDMFDGKIMDHPQQVFSNSAASEILINDLINIMGSKESSGIFVDTVDNNICRWSVTLDNFHPRSKMSKDLDQIREFYGYGNVQLELEFTMDLYPSHPPIIQFVRPKLVGVFDRKDWVKLANWNPARDMMSVLKEIKDYIDRNGAVDVGNKCNGVRLGDVEKILTELKDAIELETESTLDTDFSRSTLKSNTKDLGEPRHFEKCFAGTNKHSTSAFLAASEETNSEIETILTKFLNCLRNSVFESVTKNYVAFDRPENNSYCTFNLTLNNNFFDEKNYEVTSSETPSYSYSTFKAINQLMENEKLQPQSRYANHQKVDMPCDKNHCNITTNPSFGLGSRARFAAGLQNEKYSVNNFPIRESNSAANYGERNRCNSNIVECRNKAHSVVSSFNANIKTLQGLSAASSNNCTLGLNANYSCVLKIIEESVLLTFIRSKLAVDGFFEIWLTTSLYSKIIEILIELAPNICVSDLLATSDTPDQGTIADRIKILEKNVTLILKMLTDIADGCTIYEADLVKAELAKSIIKASKLIKSQVMKYQSRKLSDEVFSVSSNQILDSSFNHQSLNSVYKDSLKALKFRNCNIDLETHTFKNNYIADVDSSRNYFRLAQEFAVLSQSLPLELSSSIFVRMDNLKPSLMRAVITGMENTCCSGGCFSFDIYLRKDYPDDGLEIYCTTFVDSESTRLPNNCKASLSFEEVSKPDPELRAKISTILQVLTSIKNQKLSLKLCAENCESRDLEGSGTEETLVSNVIQFAMIGQMRKPTPGFEEMIENHFRIRKDGILSELEQFDFLKNSKLLDSLKTEFQHLTSSPKT